jgi:hypothetical protein
MRWCKVDVYEIVNAPGKAFKPFCGVFGIKRQEGKRDDRVALY